jgi:hypothetical protein
VWQLSVTVIETFVSGSSGCQWALGTWDDIIQGKVTTKYCSASILPLGRKTTCGSLNGTLTLVFKMANNVSVSSSNMATYLDILGLRGVQRVGYKLSIMWFGPRVPVTIDTARILPNLTYNLGVVDVQDYTPPGFSGGLKEFVLPSLQVAASLVVNNTSFQTMTSFSNLVCVGFYTIITNNPSLTTLSGLESLLYSGLFQHATVPYGLVIRNNPLLNSIGFIAVQPLAGCPGSCCLSCAAPCSPLFQAIDVQLNNCAAKLTNYYQLCNVVRTCPS